jgi:hypothetical protein
MTKVKGFMGLVTYPAIAGRAQIVALDASHVQVESDLIVAGLFGMYPQTAQVTIDPVEFDQETGEVSVATTIGPNGEELEIEKHPALAYMGADS